MYVCVYSHYNLTSKKEWFTLPSFVLFCFFSPFMEVLRNKSKLAHARHILYYRAGPPSPI